MTTDYQTLFRRQGYCIYPQPLTELELQDLRKTVDILLAEDSDDGGGKFHDIGKGDARRFLRQRHKDFPELEQFLFSAKMQDLAVSLIGPTAYLFNEQFVVKGANSDGYFAWHQDSYYVGFEHKPYVTVWIALDDAIEENGCVYALPRNLDEDISIIDHTWDAQAKDYVGYTGEDKGVALTCKAGTIAAFSSTTLHCSGANRTQLPRRALVCQYSPEAIIDPQTGAPKHFAIELRER